MDWIKENYSVLIENPLILSLIIKLTNLLKVDDVDFLLAIMTR